MRRLPALLLACALLVIVCVPTTHAMQHDPGKPQPHIVFQPESPVVADDGAWVDLKATQGAQPGFFGDMMRVIAACFNAYFGSPTLTTTEMEVTTDHGESSSQSSRSGGSASRR